VSRDGIFDGDIGDGGRTDGGVDVDYDSGVENDSERRKEGKGG
jgi:hypothetical protein